DVLRLEFRWSTSSLSANPQRMDRPCGRCKAGFGSLPFQRATHASMPLASPSSTSNLHPWRPRETLGTALFGACGLTPYSAARIVKREHALASFLHLRIPSRKPASTFPGFSLEPVEASRIVDQNLATGLHIRNPYREKIEQMPGVDWEVGCDLRSTHGTR